MNSKAVGKNYVKVVGTLISEMIFSYERYGEQFYEGTLKVERLNTEHSDEIPIVVSERLIDISACEIGTRLSITGQFRSYNVPYDNDETRKKLLLQVFAKDASILPTEVGEDAAEEAIDTEVGGDAFEEKVHTTPTMDQNDIELLAFICKEPLYRKTPLGRDITDCLLAVNRQYGKSDYIPSIAWGRNAKYLARLPIGTCVEIKGRIQSRKYYKKISDTETVSKTVYEVSIFSIAEVNRDVYKEDNN